MRAYRNVAAAALLEDLLCHKFKILQKLLPDRDFTNLKVLTREQAESSLFKDERKLRITASNFGKVVKQKGKVRKGFMDSLFNHKRF